MSEGADPVFEALEKDAYDLLFRKGGYTAETAFEALKRDGVNETLVEMAIESAYSLRHEQALRGELEWASWLGAVARDPGRSGVGVKVLCAITAVVTLIAVIWTIGLFPPGRYPQIVLMLPGIAIGLAFFFFGSFPVYSYERKKTQALRAADDGKTPAQTTAD